QRGEEARNEEEPDRTEDVERDHVPRLRGRANRVEPAAGARTAARLDDRRLPEPLRVERHEPRFVARMVDPERDHLVLELGRLRALVVRQDDAGSPPVVEHVLRRRWKRPRLRYVVDAAAVLERR